MGSKLEQILERTGDETHRLLMCALVAGDPHVEGTIEYLNTVAESGADLIELIVPFSDPAYHGPVIQRACDRALREDLSWDDVRDIADNFGAEHDTPLVVSSYYNRILAYGIERFAQLVDDVGIEAVMVADLPWEESGDLREALEPHGVPLVPMVAPTTREARTAKMAKESTTFFVWTGHSGGEVTLSRGEFEQSMEQFKAITSRPIIASMKISTGEEAAAVVDFSDGVLVGSALVWLVEGRDADLSDRLAAFVAELRESIDAEGA